MSAPKTAGFMSSMVGVHRATADHDPDDVIRVVSRVMQNTPREDWPDLLRTLFYPPSDDTRYKDGTRKGHAR
jgi:hypothetical protein